ncbi:MAG: type II secretion system F family protein [Anaerolineae bacterium]|nr:type II secretion system F family protein [Anaerolineae bacterium]
MQFPELIALVGALVTGVGIWIAYDGLVRPRRRTAAQTTYLYEGLEVRLQQNRLPVRAERFLIEGALVGVLLAALSVLAAGAWAAVAPMFLCGFAVIYTVYEGRRDALAMEYNAGVALAAGQISNAWLAQPSISNALESVIVYGHPEVARDFEQARAAMGAGKNLTEAFAPIADRRCSPFLDGLVMALASAERATGDIRGLLEGIADSTREQVEIFKDYIVASANARQEVLWAVFAPWGLILISRLLSAMPGAVGGEGLEVIFASPVGSAMLFAAGLVTLLGYRQMTTAMQQGIVLDRIQTEEA